METPSSPLVALFWTLVKLSIAIFDRPLFVLLPWQFIPSAYFGGLDIALGPSQRLNKGGDLALCQ